MVVVAVQGAPNHGIALSHVVVRYYIIQTLVLVSVAIVYVLSNFKS